MKPTFLILLLFRLLPTVFAGPLYSPTWGFFIDPPEGYVYIEGNDQDRYSFEGPNGLQCTLRVYSGVYQTMRELADDVTRRLSNRGDMDFFTYRDKSAAMIELRFGGFTGWGLAVELEAGGGGAARPMLLALSYGPADAADMDIFHLSVLDSIAPSSAERRCPGPIMEYGFPRGKQRQTALARPGLSAQIRENDAEAAQVLVDREYSLLSRYQSAENWKAAWIRFYRAVYRDSWDRIADAVVRLGQGWAAEGAAGGGERRALAERSLAWVQGFSYERDIEGSDFVNLVSAVTEGRGDCDTRAMLWAIILTRAEIPAAIMISREYSHAMGLADIPGEGARFEAAGTKWLVAETTADVGIGLIGQNVSNAAAWFAVTFD
jgi:hypothetical protein